MPTKLTMVQALVQDDTGSKTTDPEVQRELVILKRNMGRFVCRAVGIPIVQMYGPEKGLELKDRRLVFAHDPGGNAQDDWQIVDFQGNCWPVTEENLILTMEGGL